MQIRICRKTESLLRKLKAAYVRLSPCYDISLAKLADGLLLDKAQQELRRFKK